MYVPRSATVDGCERTGAAVASVCTVGSDCIFMRVQRGGCLCGDEAVMLRRSPTPLEFHTNKINTYNNQTATGYCWWNGRYAKT